MDAVKSFNAELAGLYECKPPISKAKMTAITKGAIRAIKFYKHVVQSVEKFIQKCKTEYKIPGLYVIDSIVRQSRHQFGVEKDVFAPRFAKNILVTFFYLFKCPQEDKSKVIRVLNLWQKNQVFAEEVIQPLFDLADPNHPIQKEVSNQIAQKSSRAKQQQHQQQQQHSGLQEPPQGPPASGGGGGGGGGAPGRHESRGSDTQINSGSANTISQQQSCRQERLLGSTERSQAQIFVETMLYGPHSEDLQKIRPVPVTSVSSQVMSAAVTNLDPGLIQQIQQILMKQPTAQDDPAAAAAAAAAAASMVPPVPDEVKTQTIPGLGGAGDFGEPARGVVVTGDFDGRPLPFLTVDTSQPPPGYLPPGPFMPGLPPTPMAVPPPGLEYGHPPPDKPKSPREEGEHSDDSDEVKEIRHEDRDADRRRRSRSRSRSRSRRRRRTRSRSRSRSRSRHRRSRSRSRGRRSSSRSRRRRSRSRDRERDRDRDRRDRDRDRDREREREREKEKEKLDPEKEREREKEREKERERKKRGLPPIKKEHLSVCSTTLWVGHLSKLVHQEELSDTFGEYGDIVSIDLIPPRGCAFICMNRRQDAARALSKLRNHKMHNKAITLAWAPGKGVKGKEFKDYWEVEVGCSYVPFHKIITMSSVDLDNLEEGGMIDEETVPEWLRGRYGLEAGPPPTGPPPGFVPIGVPPGHPPNTRSQEMVAPMPPMPPPPVEKNPDVSRDGPPPPMGSSGPGMPPTMLPPPFGLPNMPPPQVGPGHGPAHGPGHGPGPGHSHGHGPGPGGMPPLPQGFVPPSLPPIGVPPPMGLPPMGVHPPVSSILGQPLIGAMPPPVSMAPNMPTRPLLGPGGELQNSLGSAPITTIANSSGMVNSNSLSHDSNDMDIEMEDVDKTEMRKENGVEEKDKEERAERRKDRPSRFERPGDRSPSSAPEEKLGLVERLRNLASGGVGMEQEPRDRYDRDRRDRDRDRGRDMRDREDRISDREPLRGRDTNRFGPDTFSGPPPGYPQQGQRPQDGPPGFRADGSGGPNGPGGPGSTGGFNNFVGVPRFGPPGSGTGGPPGMMGGPPGPHAGMRGEGFGPMGLGLMSGHTAPGFGPQGLHGPGGFAGPRGLLGPPPMGIGSLLGSRPPLMGDMPGGPNGGMRGPAGGSGGPGMRGPAGGMPGMWMENHGPRFQGHDPHMGPPGGRDGLAERPWEAEQMEGDRFREAERPREEGQDHSRDDDRPGESRAMDDRARGDRRRDDRFRDDRTRDDRTRDDRSRDDRSRGDRSRDDRSRGDRYRGRDDGPRDDRARDGRSRDDRSRDERSRDDRPRDDRSRDDRSRDDRSRDDRPWEGRSRDGDRRRDEQRPWEKSRWGPREEEGEEEVEMTGHGGPDSWDMWARMAEQGSGPKPTPTPDHRSSGPKEQSKEQQAGQCTDSKEQKQEDQAAQDGKSQQTEEGPADPPQPQESAPSQVLEPEVVMCEDPVQEAPTASQQSEEHSQQGPTTPQQCEEAPQQAPTASQQREESSQEAPTTPQQCEGQDGPQQAFAAPQECVGPTHQSEEPPQQSPTAPQQCEGQDIPQQATTAVSEQAGSQSREGPCQSPTGGQDGPEGPSVGQPEEAAPAPSMVQEPESAADPASHAPPAGSSSPPGAENGWDGGNNSSPKSQVGGDEEGGEVVGDFEGRANEGMGDEEEGEPQPPDPPSPSSLDTHPNED